MTTATKITFIRIFLIPLYIIFMMLGNEAMKIAALAVFIVASITDFIDGYIARHYNQVSNLGKFLDPLADKLLVTAALILFVELKQMAAWIVFIVMARELAIQGMRLIAVEKGKVIAAGWSGKIKTASTMICICIMMLPFHTYAFTDGFTIDTLCSFIIVATTVYSGIEYFIKNRKIFSKIA